MLETEKSLDNRMRLFTWKNKELKCKTHFFEWLEGLFFSQCSFHKPSFQPAELQKAHAAPDYLDQCS